MAGFAGGAIKQGDVHGGFGGELSRGKAVHMGHAGFEVVKRELARVQLGEKIQAAGGKTEVI